MATYTFLNIGKANAEIDRLAGELTKVQAEAKTATENAELISNQAESLQSDLTQASSDLTTAKTSISTLTTRAEKAEADLKLANDKLANPGEQVKILASHKALEITQGQGQPPVESKPGQVAGGDILAQHAAIKDPGARMEFYRKNKAAYDAAWREKNPDQTKE